MGFYRDWLKRREARAERHHKAKAICGWCLQERGEEHFHQWHADVSLGLPFDLEDNRRCDMHERCYYFGYLPFYRKLDRLQYIEANIMNGHALDPKDVEDASRPTAEWIADTEKYLLALDDDARCVDGAPRGFCYMPGCEFSHPKFK